MDTGPCRILTQQNARDFGRILLGREESCGSGSLHVLGEFATFTAVLDMGSSRMVFLGVSCAHCSRLYISLSCESYTSLSSSAASLYREVA